MLLKVGTRFEVARMILQAHLKILFPKKGVRIFVTLGVPPWFSLVKVPPGLVKGQAFPHSFLHGWFCPSVELILLFQDQQMAHNGTKIHNSTSAMELF